VCQNRKLGILAKRSSQCDLWSDEGLKLKPKWVMPEIMVLMNSDDDKHVDDSQVAGIRSTCRTSMEINGVTVEIEEKSIKNLHLSVYPPHGKVHISVPRGTGLEKIRLYVLQKWVWLSEKRRLATAHTRQLKRDYISGEEHFVRGQSYRLKVIKTDSETVNHVQIIGDYLTIYVSGEATVKKRAEVLDNWYREDLKTVLAKLISKWEMILEVKVSEWEVLRMSARWGSCNPEKAKVIFNLELAKKPDNCVEYVVAHELAHLIERTHDNRFQQILFTHLPNWQELRQQLNDFPLSETVTKERDNHGL